MVPHGPQPPQLTSELFCCHPSWMWRTDCGRCQWTHTSGEQIAYDLRIQLAETFATLANPEEWQGGNSKLSDTLLPVINHCKRRPIDLHFSMILEEKIIDPLMNAPFSAG